MTVAANNHSGLLDFFGCGSFHDVDHIKAAQGCITVFPGNTWTLSLNCFRYGLSEVLEVLRILDRFRGNTTENHICRHNSPPAAPKLHPASVNHKSETGTIDHTSKRCCCLGPGAFCWADPSKPAGQGRIYFRQIAASASAFTDELLCP